MLDFGLVKHEAPSHATTLLTAERVTMGTPAYMAPEVILGNPDVDRRVDVYALGCVAYFLLTGERVFEAENPMKLLMQHVQEEPIPPSRRTKQHIPRQIDDLVLACLRKDPNERPSNVDDLFQIACGGRSADLWDQRLAKTWWETHDVEDPPDGIDHAFGPALSIALN